jgi:hypothetical protein
MYCDKNSVLTKAHEGVNSPPEEVDVMMVSIPPRGCSHMMTIPMEVPWDTQKHTDNTHNSSILTVKHYMGIWVLLSSRVIVKK